ncbi:hypothetical protein AXE80_11550 [Wenyingzhuangia fucanilytica]|uniref:Sulfatase N-terminal domain-containing protein n=1 Tax=Wenyingzhuangia fucanilytica TaxID=1790137 RepID=A0A1B1Y817_9FLAO|nr:hypothetical protein AXE80_11550 [Wenyingzhuangia fucanilytica]
MADDLGINALNCYGNNLVSSPNIDKLFNEGMHFTNGYSNDPTCAPSRASIITGQYVPRHGIYRVADRYKSDPKTLKAMKYLPPKNHIIPGFGVGVSPDKVFLPEALKANGYRTAGFGKWHVAKGKSPSSIPAKFDEGFEIAGHYKFRSDPVQKVADTVYSSDYITQKGIDFIHRMTEQHQPFFLYMPYYLVHKPLEPKQSYVDLLKAKLKQEKLSTEEIKVLAMIMSLDENVGQLMQVLKEKGIEENTIIVFTSDNGHYKTKNSNMFSKPYRGNKGETLEGGIRVPYIFKWKDHIKAKSVSKAPIIHVDIYPTLLGLTNSKQPNETLDGEDLSPLLLGKKDHTNRKVLAWEYTNYARWNAKEKSFVSSWVNVIQKDGFKLTENVETDAVILYNLNTDPYETKECASEYPKVVADLKNELAIWKTTTGYTTPKKNQDFISK